MLHVADEAHALARDRPHQLLLVAAVADCLAHRIDAAVEGRIRNNSATPYGRDQIILADDAVAILDEIDQEIENLRLDRDDRATRAQLPALRLERKISECKQHVVARNFVKPKYISALKRREINRASRTNQ